MKLENDANQERADNFAGDPAENVSETVVNAQGEQIALPPGASLEDLSVEGRDLVITLADGSRIVIPDGAINVPQILVDGVVVPPQTVAALLLGNEPEPAAGAPQSSGGNFADDEGAIQDAFDIGDLLPFTQLAFPEDREEEIIPASDEEPEVVIETPDNPTGVENAIATVDEDGLPERGDSEDVEPEGTRSETDSEITNGTIVFSAPDGLRAILINGEELTTPGQTFTSPLGTLTITSIDLETGEVGFTYVLQDNALGEEVDGFFEVTVIDADGDEAVATLSIIIEDDGPIAADDIGIVPAGSHDAITGDVLVNDEPGADGYALEGAVQGFSNEGGAAAPGETLQGEFGTLTLNADGTYTYIRDINTPGGVEESFEYTIVDQDGSTSTATLTIQIEDAPDAITDVPRIGEGTVVDEAGLPPREDGTVGSGEIADDVADNNSDPSEATGSVIEFNSPDGLASVTLNGVEIDPDNLPQTIIDDGTGTLVVTDFTYDPVTGDGTITYEYTLGDNTDGDDVTVEIDIRVEDLDGDVAEDTLIITVVDDEPEAVDDSAAQESEDAPVTVDVFDNDTPGADGVALDQIAAVDGTLSGTGTLAYNGDGTFTYTPGPGEEDSVTFDYTITDGDGDVSTATVTIVLEPDSTPEISAEGEDTANEAGLPARGSEPEGSDEPSDSEFTSGVITINTGNDTVGSLVVNGEDVTSGGTVTTAKGVLTVTLNAGVYEYSYELTDNTLSDPDTDSFSVTVTDSDGDTASTTIVIAILDDVPTAEDDAGALAAGEYGPVGGDVLANDTQGADGAVVTSYTGAGGSGDAGTTVQGQYGVLTIAADGTYSYTRDPGTPGGVSDTFTYTITDGDGDTSSADLVIAIANSTTTLDLPTAGEEGTEVDEAGLAGPPAGSDAASDSETTQGTFTFTAPDGPATITIDGVAVTSVGQTFTGTYGTLEITGIADGAITYSYTLGTNTAGDTTSDGFVVRVTDVDGDFSEDTLTIDIVDDVATANADTNGVTEGASATGNVLVADGKGSATDVFGADGAEAAGGVVGVRAAGGDTTTDASGDVGVTINGLYGTLTLNADGSYTYASTADGVTGDVADVFVYTIEDSDGDLSTTTLTIDVTDVTLDPDNVSARVDEAALDSVGSDPASTAETTSGQLNVAGAVNYVLDSASDTYGTLTLNPDGSYSYTLTTPFDTSPDADNGTNTELGAESYSYTATDANGNTVTGTITIDIVDDIPTANADTNSVDEGTFETGNVLVADGKGSATDVFGADGAEAAGGVVGVRAAGGDTTTDASGNVGVTINGLYGTLTLNADGSYTYASTADAVTGDVADVFVYTIEDGDGDLSTTTLTIDVTDVTLDPDNVSASVDEAALDSVGSDPASTAETTSGQLNVTGAVNYALDSASDTYGTLTLNPDGSYTYTLTAPFDTSPDADDGTNTELGAESYSYTATDANGNTVTGTITIDIVDDIPTANADTNGVDEGTFETGNVLVADGKGSASDVFGADGAEAAGGVVGVRAAGGDTTTDASGNVGVTINGLYGTLTLNADGSYTYVSTPNSTNTDVVDVFVYTIEDGDGDLSTTTLTIDVINAPGEVSDNDALVNEAGLPAGSDPTSDSEIDADGQITVVGATGTLVYNLLSPADGTYGTLVLDSATGEYTYTLDTPFTDMVDENGTNVVNGAESFNYEVRDTNGNLIGTGSIDVSIIDDIPTATDQASVSVAEDAVGTIGGNVTTDGTPDTPGADGASVTAITVGGIETAVPQDGSDATVVTANGTYTIDMDGNWTFDPNPNLDHTAGDIDASFTYTLTDSDGDFDTADQPILITDGTDPSAGPDISLALDDQNLADGSTPGATTDSDSILFTEGSDDIVSIVFGDTSALGGGLTWTRVSDNQIIGEDGGRLVVTLDLSVADTTATVTATLNDNYDDHPTINVDDLVDLGDVDVVATDLDGDTASATVSVSVSDDLPSISAGDPAADALTVDETDLATDAMADFSVLFTSSFNADNPGTPASYALGINAGSTGLVDTATDEAVVLVLNGGVVEGRTDTTNELVFTVSVDAAGMVTLDQQRAVKHADDTDDNDPATLDAANLITLTATIIDSDGDTASATANIAGALTFLDDGPSLSNVLLGSSVSVDETDGLTTSATSAASILSFTADYGEDGDNGATFALTITDTNSGLATADGDYPITLVQTSATVITGTFDDGGGDQPAFTVEINADGTITLTQIVALEHLIDGDDSAGEHNDTLNLAGKIEASVTIKDGDGDTDTVGVQVGGALTFFDDGPSVTLSGVNDSLSVSDVDFGTDDSENFADNFSFDGGEDGTASTSFALFAVNETDSGLIDTTTGNSIFLFLEGGAVVGREGTDATDAATGDEVFRVTVDGSGNVTLDQSRAVDHDLSTGSDGATVSLASDGLVQLIGTVTDNDGDTASTALDIGSNLSFTDDTPALSNVGLGTGVDVDETDAGSPGGFPISDTSAASVISYSADFGNDGDGGAAFTLSIDDAASGLATANGDFPITLVQTSSTTIEGRYDGANVAFLVTINGDGTVTLQQNVALEHLVDGDDSAGEHNDTLDLTGKISATVTITDGDTDTDAATVSIGSALTFFDDGPSVSAAPDLASSVTLDETNLAAGTKTIDLGTFTQGNDPDVTGSPTLVGAATTGNILAVTADFGADGEAAGGGLAYKLEVGNSNTGLFTTDGTLIQLISVSDTVVVGVISGVNTAAFAFEIDPATGELTVEQYMSLRNFDDTDPNDLVQLDAGSLTAVVTATDDDGDIAESSAVDVTTLVTFLDDGPSVSAIVDTGSALTLDETNLAAGAGTIDLDTFTQGTDPDVDVSPTVVGGTTSANVLDVTSDFGADGSVDGLEYSLVVANADTGLFTTDGTLIQMISVSDTVVVGVISGVNTAAFAFEIDPATGEVTVEQYMSLRHLDDTDPNDPVQLAAGSLTVAVSATDGDGDPAAASAVDITSLFSFLDDVGTLGAFSPDTQVIGNVADATAGGTFAYDTGADGHGQFNITGPTLEGVVYQPLFHGLVDATDDSVDNATVEGTLLTATNADGTVTLFTIAVDIDGNFKYTLVTPDAGETQTVSLLGLTAGGPQPFVETPDFLIEFTGSDNGINSSTQGFGINNQFVGNGQSFTIEFHSVGTPGDDAPLDDPEFVSSFVLKNDNINGSLEITVTVYNDADGTSEVIGPINVTGTETLIDPVVLDTFNRVEVVGTGGSGQGVRFTSLDFTKNILPDNLDLDFVVSAVDGDGDVTSTSTVNVMVDASASASTTSSASTVSFSTSQMLLSETMVVSESNDNGLPGSNGQGGRGGSPQGGGLDSFSMLQTSFRSDIRTSEMTLVAAISGAVMLDHAISGDPMVGPIQTGSVGYDLVAIDDAMEALAPQAIVGAEAHSGLLHAEFDTGIDAGSIDWSGLSGESALASSAETIIGLQDQPYEFELYQGEDQGFEAPAMSAFFDGPASGVDQAMEALLSIEPGTNAIASGAGIDAMVDALAADANAVIADITVDATLEQMIEGLTGPADVAGYLTAEAGAIDAGLLDQMIDNAAHSINPMTLMDAQIDEAAASAVPA